MNAASRPVRELLELCIVQNDDEAWKVFLDRYTVLVRQAFGASMVGGLRIEEFLEWFPGWLYSTRKLHALHRAIVRQWATGELEDENAVEHYTRNYLVNIVRSAVGDWFRGNPELKVPQARSDFSPTDQKTAEWNEEAFGRLRNLVLSLRQELRMPFWLRYYQAFGPLPADDLLLLAEVHRTTAEEIDQAIRRAADSQPSRSLSARFIGDLLGLSPLGNGAYAAVHQRVRRALVLIRKLALENQP